MKLPFEFGVKLIFRLVFPGAILAAALTPAVRAVLDASGIRIKFDYLFPLETIAFGWAVVISDMHIYLYVVRGPQILASRYPSIVGLVSEAAA